MADETVRVPKTGSTLQQLFLSHQLAVLPLAALVATVIYQGSNIQLA